MSLEEVLRFREKKALLQEKMIRENPGAVIVSMGMNIPGPVKSGPMIYAAFHEGLERLEELSGKKKGMRTVKVLMEEAAGYAAVCLAKEQDPYSVKRAAIRLEESHPLGRLWDIDVFQDSPEAVSRETVGAERRTCLLCGRDAKECARSRRHDIRKLQDKVTEIIAGWQTGNRT